MRTKPNQGRTKTSWHGELPCQSLGFACFQAQEMPRLESLCQQKLLLCKNLLFFPQCSPWRAAGWDVQAPDDTILSGREAGHTNLLWLQGREMWLGKTETERAATPQSTSHWDLREDEALPFGQKHKCEGWKMHSLNPFWCLFLLFLPTILHLEEKKKILLSLSAMQITLHLDEKHY